jgi:phage baseplate assembly protein W
MLTTYAFPFRLDKQGRPVMLSHAESLAQRVRMLVHSGIGTLFFMRAEGSTLPLVLNKPNELTLINVAISQTQVMIDRQEPRVKNTKITILKRSAESLEVSVTYLNNLINIEETFTTVLR